MVMVLAVDDLAVNRQYIHKETGNIYEINAFVRSKNPDNGSWYDAILYTRVETGYSYVRSIENFMENFDNYDDTETVIL